MSNEEHRQHHHHHHHHHAGESMKSEDILVKDSSIQLLAYQIHQEKGGPALDNWLEAERTLNSER